MHILRGTRISLDKANTDRRIVVNGEASHKNKRFNDVTSSNVELELFLRNVLPVRSLQAIAAATWDSI